jgi:hypothetical protein
MVRGEGTNQKAPLDYATKLKVEVIWPITKAIVQEWDWSPIASTTIVPVPESAGDPFAWFIGELDGGRHQLIDPITCGLKDINPVSGTVGNCSPEQLERREGGLTAVGSAAKGASGVSYAATAVDALCGWGTP